MENPVSMARSSTMGGCAGISISSRFFFLPLDGGDNVYPEIYGWISDQGGPWAMSEKNRGLPGEVERSWDCRAALIGLSFVQYGLRFPAGQRFMHGHYGRYEPC
jgi:hypothetical protein